MTRTGSRERKEGGKSLTTEKEKEKEKKEEKKRRRTGRQITKIIKINLKKAKEGGRKRQR